ncbi:hypothetical protein [Terrabacter ginsenosidimutans]|jgi:hypothetical protein
MTRGMHVSREQRIVTITAVMGVRRSRVRRTSAQSNRGRRVTPIAAQKPTPSHDDPTDLTSRLHIAGHRFVPERLLKGVEPRQLELLVILDGRAISW